MKRLSMLGLFFGCLALVSRGMPVASSAALAQESDEGEAAHDEAPPDEAAGAPDPSEETDDAVTNPRESPDESYPADPSGDDGGSGGDNGDTATGADQAGGESPAEVPAS
jgi:hypothetical protein